MIIHDVIQGGPEWLALRAGRNTASEASAMMGASPYIKRSELLRMAATGSQKEYSAFVQERILDKGHEIEALARPIAEAIIGGELYPCTATSDEPGLDHLLASFDGVTMDESLIWECKSWNAEKAAIVHETQCVPEADFWQVQQQLIVSRAQKCLYMVTDGTEENTVYCWAATVTGDNEEKLLAHWDQFNKDVAAYQPEQIEKAEVIAEAVDDLPAVYVQVSGSVAVQDNFSTFEAALRHFLSEVLITDPQTDQDFADLDQQIKAMKKAETALDAAEGQMLAQVQEVNDLKRAKDALHDLVRKNRLAAEKLLSAQKDKIKLEIRQQAETKYRAHLAALEETLTGMNMPEVTADFAGAMKNKRTIASLKDAVDTELAKVIVDSSKLAEKLRTNLRLIDEKAGSHLFLFFDRPVLAMHDSETLVALIEQRISKHQAEEAARLELERERIRKEEAARIEREQQAAENTARTAEAVRQSAEAALKPAPATALEGILHAPVVQPPRGKTPVTVHLDNFPVEFLVEYTPGERGTRFEPGYEESIEWEAVDKTASAFIEHFSLHFQIEELIWEQMERDKEGNLP